MFSITSARYFLFNQATDMRKSFDGLSAIVHSQMKQNPWSGDVYVFLNRSRNRIKLLRWETDGFVSLFDSTLSANILSTFDFLDTQCNNLFILLIFLNKPTYKKQRNRG
jgi:transposase